MTNKDFRDLFGSAFNSSTYARLVKRFATASKIYYDDAKRAITDGIIVICLRDEIELYDDLKNAIPSNKSVSVDLSRVLETHISKATPAKMTNYAFVPDKKHIARLFTGSSPVLIDDAFLDLVPVIQCASFSSSDLSLVVDCCTFYYVFLPIATGEAGDKLKKAFKAFS